MRIWLCILGILAVFSSTARAQTCFDFSSGVDFNALDLAQVKPGEKRVYFNTGDCGEASCKSKAFVVPGDLVLIEQVFDESACAVFVNKKGVATYGLLPNDRLTSPDNRHDESEQALIGRWLRTEAEITVQDGGEPGQMRFDGSATFGALDEERVANGGVNTGAFSFLLAPSSGTIPQIIAPEPDENGAPKEARMARELAKPDDYFCALEFAARGPYLAVRDNNQCGGNNVSFTGVYRWSE
jgi:hypothetical protein